MSLYKPRPLRSSGLLLAFCISLGHAQSVLQTDTLEYAISMRGKPVGFMKGWLTGDGRFHDYVWINDRGRGDSLHITYEFNTESIPIFVELSGHDYFKNTVEEEFDHRSEIARWQNESETEERILSKPSYYLLLKGSFAFSRNLVKAIHGAHGDVNLLPSGHAHMDILREHHVRGVELQLCRITGLDMTPSYLWVDSTLTEFAYVSDWVNIVRKGFESAQSKLREIQKNEENKFFEQKAIELTENPESILIEDVSLFDAKNGSVHSSMNVLIRDGVIKEVSSRRITKPGVVRTIDGRNQMLLPGLIDMHAHPSSHDGGLLNIACGVTSIRDMGGDFNSPKYGQEVESGKAIGPTVEWISGLIDGKGPFAGPTTALAGSAEEALAWVDSFANAGFSGIKIYSSIRPEWVQPIAQRAKSHGMRVSGHIPAYMTAEQAIKSGYDEIQHENMLFLNFYGDTVDTRSPLRFTIPAQRAASFDFGSQTFNDFISLLKQRHVTIDPTIGIFEALFTARPKKIDPLLAPYVEFLPPTVQRYAKAGGGGLPVTPEQDTLYQRSLHSFLILLKRLYDEGISLVPGTDGLPGLLFQRELELYVEAGIPANEVLRIATIHSAGILRKESTIGSIEKGKRANMFLVTGDPMKNISDLRNVTSVIKDGKLYDSKKVLRALSFNY